MKILDRYILITYLRSFFSILVILIFIFILQSLWLYFGEIAGKGLDFEIISKFLIYNIPKLMPLVLPLTILLSSIMVFGNFSENYEFAAMKSTGISLQRAMRSLMVFIIMISIGTFFFANDIIPYSEFKFLNLRRNIVNLKPALAISEGIFNEVGSINIKVDDKYGDRDQFLKNVIIHQKTNREQNNVVIKAKTGELRNDDENNVLQLILNDGNRYEDVVNKDPKEQKKNPHAKAHFEHYTMNIDLSKFNDVDLDEEKFKNTYKMQNIGQLNQSIDSLEKDRKEKVRFFGENVHKRSGIMSLNTPEDTPEKDSVKFANIPTKKTDQKKVKFQPTDNVDTLLSRMEGWRRVQIIDQALNTVKNQGANLRSKKSDFNRKNKLINHHYIAFHDKFALAFACVILFFVGAPLGAIIRKGGMGLPMVMAILIFLTYHFIGMFGKNSAENGNIPPFLGAWLSTLIMFPLSIWFTRKATTDQGIFDTDAVVQPVKNFFNRLAGYKTKKKASEATESE